MFDIDKWQEIYSSIRKHKLRTILTAFGVAWGIFMLIILLGAGNALQSGAEYEFRDDAVNSIWVWPGTVSKPHKGLPIGRRLSFKNSDVDATKTHVDGVEYITARYYIPGSFTTSYKNKSVSYSVRCVHPDHLVLENTIMTSGRFINEFDLKEKRKVACIGNLVKDGLFGDEDPIGKYITVKGVDFKVVGVYTDTGGDSEKERIYLPVYTAQLAFNGRDRINQFMFTTGDATVEEAEVIEANLRKDLAERHRFDPKDKKALWLRNNVENFQRFMTLFSYIRAFVWFVGIGTLIAGIIGVSNIMLIIVKERTKEIGIRKALGATSWSIVSLIIQESVLITGLAGYFGLLGGIGLLQLYVYIKTEAGLDTGFFRDPFVDFGVAATAVVVLVICGALAGLVPAVRAARVNPVVAMRDE
ncbi:MAG: ABC transporter permease [Flammeovirgaceae bacterium]